MRNLRKIKKITKNAKIEKMKKNANIEKMKKNAKIEKMRKSQKSKNLKNLKNPKNLKNLKNLKKSKKLLLPQLTPTVQSGSTKLQSNMTIHQFSPVEHLIIKIIAIPKFPKLLYSSTTLPVLTSPNRKTPKTE